MRPPPFTQDALTYLAAVWCAKQLPEELGGPDAAAKQLKKFSSMRSVELTAALEQAAEEEEQKQQHAQRRGRPGSRSDGRGGGGGSRAAEDAAEKGGHPAGVLTHAEHRHHHEQQPVGWQPTAAGVEALPDREVEVLHPPGGSGGSVSLGARSSGGSTLTAATSALAEGVRALGEGWHYVSNSANRDVAALVLMKCAAATVWGAGGPERRAMLVWCAVAAAAPLPGLHLHLPLRPTFTFHTTPTPPTHPLLQWTS